MTWQHSTARNRTRTPEWRRLRLQILDRDNRRCYLCAAAANEVDHIVRAGAGGTDDPANLAAICAPCHHRKSAQEAAEARSAKGRQNRPPEKHPGIL